MIVLSNADICLTSLPRFPAPKPPSLCLVHADSQWNIQNSVKLFFKPVPEFDHLISCSWLRCLSTSYKMSKKKIDCGVCSVIINSILHQPKFVSLRPGQSRNCGWIDAFILVGGATFFSTHYFEGLSGSETIRPAVTLQSEFSSLSAAAACAHHAGGICAVWLSFKDLQRLPAAQPDGETTSKPQEIKSIVFSPASLAETDFGIGIPAEIALTLSDCLSPLAQSYSAGVAYAKQPVLQEGTFSKTPLL